MTTTKDDDVLNYNEAAAFLGVSRRTLEKMVSAGEVPSIPVRARRTFSRSLLTKWREARAEESVSKGKRMRNVVVSLVNL